MRLALLLDETPLNPATRGRLSYWIMSSVIGLLKYLVTMSTLIAGFFFALRNSEPVGLWLVHEFTPQPLGLWVLLAFSVGGLSGLLLGFGMWRRIGFAKQLRELESELQTCRHQLALAIQREFDQKCKM